MIRWFFRKFVQVNIHFVHMKSERPNNIKHKSNMKNIYNSSKESSFNMPFNETFYDQTESKYTNIETESTQYHDELPGGQRSTNDILHM